MAGILNLTIDQGSNYTNSITVYQADGVTPSNLTGYTVASQFRKNYTSTAYTAFTTTLVSPYTSGKINMTLTAAQTAAVKAGYYYYDVEITNSAGTVTRVMEGKIHFKPNVTRA
tara:strand:+ start:1011 stop:1352 length:342 start_codon:yes stop_codon:yes gene_type:complete